MNTLFRNIETKLCKQFTVSGMYDDYRENNEDEKQDDLHLVTKGLCWEVYLMSVDH